MQSASAARGLDVEGVCLGVIIIGHRASREEREDLVNHFRSVVARVPIIALTGRGDSAFDQVDYNCPADQPDSWVKMVQTALTGIS